MRKTFLAATVVSAALFGGKADAQFVHSIVLPVNNPLSCNGTTQSLSFPLTPPTLPTGASVIIGGYFDIQGFSGMQSMHLQASNGNLSPSYAVILASSGNGDTHSGPSFGGSFLGLYMTGGLTLAGGLPVSAQFINGTPEASVDWTCPAGAGNFVANLVIYWE